MKKKFSKRTIKNIIMVVLIVLIGTGSYFTMSYAAPQNDNSKIEMRLEHGDFKGGEPGGGFEKDGAPEMPQNGNMPEMTQGGENMQPPEMPQGENGKDNQKPDFGKGMKKTSAIFYVLFALEGLLIAGLILYLIMSGFNKKGFKETLKGWKRIVIYALSVAVVATCLTVTQAELSSKCFANRGSVSQKADGMPGQGGPGSESSVEASGATTVYGENETLSESYVSTSSDESAILVTDGGSAVIDNATVSKSGDTTNTESSEFNGVNAAILVQSGSGATIKGATIETNAKGANAVFATGENAKIVISDSTITSTGESSARGLDATYGGTIEADNVKITTQGGSCAALATDRGEGTVTVKNSTLETNGSGSPVIYSTGNISIENTTGTANGSQNIVIEGKNSATVTNSTLTASGKGNRNEVDNAGVMIYQSMSGDASEGTGTLNAVNSTLEIQSNSDYYKTAPMFFITNTDAVINLKNTKLVFGSGILLNAQGTNEWGNSGSNGGNVTLNAENQKLSGNITADSISEVTVNLVSSTYEGAINSDNSAKSVSLKLDKDSKIKLTGDTYVTSLDDEDTSYSNIDFGSYTLYVNLNAIN